MNIVRKPLLFLEDAKMLGVRTDLGPVQHTLRFFDNPQDKIKTVHIVGSNGKGSTAAMIESIIRAAGYATGLYTSPHLVSVYERLKYNGEEIKPYVFASLLNEIRSACRITKEELTYFEILTVAAYLYFYHQRVDVSIIEAGLGGRWDATNMLTSPVLCIVTPLSVEHRQYLGDSVEEIMNEKSCVIKNNTVVISARCPTRESERILRTACGRKKADIFVYGDDFTTELIEQTGYRQRFSYIDLTGKRHAYTLNLMGKHQTVNAGIALAAADVLKDTAGFMVKPLDCANGLTHLHWPGRFQEISCYRADRRISVIVDAAHNPAGMRSLADTIIQCRLTNILLCIGILNDKDYDAMLKIILPLAARVRPMRISHERALEPGMIAGRIKEIDNTKEVLPLVSWDELMDELKTADTTCIITGSLYLIGSFLTYIRSQRKDRSYAGIRN